MNMQVNQNQATAEALTSPRFITTINGTTLDASSMVWKIVGAYGPRTFNFLSIPFVTEDFRGALRDAFASMLLSHSADRTWNMLSALRTFFRFLSTQRPNSDVVGLITRADFLSYVGTIPIKRRHVLGLLRSLLLTLQSVGFPKIEDDLLAILPSLSFGRMKSNLAVSTMDLRSGPLTDLEYDALTNAIRSAFSEDRLSLADHVLVMLGIVLGARPTQLAMIKVKDLQVGVKENGEKFYVLRVTRLKQGKGVRPRTYFRDRVLTPDFGAVVERQCEAARTWARARRLNEEDAPLFASDHYFDQPFADAMVAVGYEYHRGGALISEKIARTLSNLRVISERTGESMRIYQTRIRRTFGTRLAAEGYDVGVISELMDHSDPGSCRVYVETRPEMIERIDKALALKMAPMAQAFLGTIVHGRPLEQAQLAPGGVVHSANAESLDALGGCGKRDYCGLAAPLACYTCALFNPWDDAPHEALLDRLIADREEQLQVADARIASVNDRTILAVAEVVNRCAALVSTRK
jgi:integrase